MRRQNVIVIQIHCQHDSHLGTAYVPRYDDAMYFVKYARENGLIIKDDGDDSFTAWPSNFLGCFNIYPDNNITPDQARTEGTVFMLPEDAFNHI